MNVNCDYDDEFDEIAEKDQPISGICFWVFTEFNVAHRAVKKRFKDTRNAAMEPDSFATYSQAMEMADEYANEIKNHFRNSDIQRLNDDLRDEFHLYIVDKMNNPIAKIGVMGEDYRRQTKH